MIPRSLLGNRGVHIGLFVAACALNLYALYVPRVSTAGGLPGFDKVAHIVIFALVMLTAIMAHVNRWVVLIVLLINLVASELIQHLLLPARSGDIWDGVADAIGIALGWFIGGWIVRRIPELGHSHPGAGPTGTAPGP